MRTETVNWYTLDEMSRLLKLPKWAVKLARNPFYAGPIVTKKINGIRYYRDTMYKPTKEE